VSIMQGRPLTLKEWKIPAAGPAVSEEKTARKMKGGENFEWKSCQLSGGKGNMNPCEEPKGSISDRLKGGGGSVG